MTKSPSRPRQDNPRPHGELAETKAASGGSVPGSLEAADDLSTDQRDDMEHLAHVMTEAARILKDRGNRYGDGIMERTAKLATLKLNRDVSPYEVAIILESLKDARRAIEPFEVEHHVDGLNYRAIGSTFKPQKHLRPFAPKAPPMPQADALEAEITRQIESDMKGDDAA